jgi:hypothetical protein
LSRTCAVWIAAIALVAAAWSAVATAQTPSIANGKTTYAAWCVGCHNANPLIDSHGVINGANNANFILNIWSTDPNMQFLLEGALPDPVQSAADIAAYLGSLVGGGTPGGQLQVPASANLGSQNVGVQSGSQPVKLTNVGGASVTVSSITSSNAGEFPIVSQNCTGGAIAAGGNCKVNVAFKPSALGARSSTLTVTSNGTGSPQTVVLTGTGVLAPPPPQANYQGLWWASPAGAEAGWGINLAHQGDTIFASWFTYDHAGKGWWLVMTASKIATNTYSGTLYTTTGPPFNAVPFNPLLVTTIQSGSGTLIFSDANNATFSYVVNGIAQNKSITREVFAAMPTCATAGSSSALASATNYQDLWWASPAGSESGWGINLTHQSDTIFAAWFTYDIDHSPMWLVVTAGKVGPGVYSGTLYRTTGPAFSAMPFNPASVASTAVGSATFTFSDGNNASFAYVVNGVSQAKAITREVFVPPGTICQ